MQDIMRGDTQEDKLTIIVPLGVIVIVIISVRRAEVLLETARAETSDAADIERVVCAHALALKTILVEVVVVAWKINLASACQVDNGLADVAAWRWDIIAVQLQIGESDTGERCEEQEVLDVEHLERLMRQ
jgi:hypothetical protein